MFFIQTKVLNWAASSNDSHEKIAFLKKFLNQLSADEASKASLVGLHVKRKKVKEENKPKDHTAVSASQHVTASPAAVAPKVPWWRPYEEDNWRNVVALDVEGVSKRQPGGLNF